MRKDEEWKNYFYDNARYADLVNGAAFGGQQVLTADSLGDLDVQTGFVREPGGGTGRARRPGSRAKAGRRQGGTKYRDMVRKAVFGEGSAVIGIELEELMDYSMPLRDMYYSVGEYEKQASQVRSRARTEYKGLKGGGFLYRFPKGTLLPPVMTVILYCGKEDWDGPRTLHEMLDFACVPDEMRKMVPDYRINILEVRRLKDTGIFRTDLRQVLDCIRLSDDRTALKSLVEGDPYYRRMEEDAYGVVACYIGIDELLRVKENNRNGGKINMCSALREMIAEGRAEGRKEGYKKAMRRGSKKRKQERVRMVRSMLERNMAEQDICDIIGCTPGFVEKIRQTM